MLQHDETDEQTDGKTLGQGLYEENATIWDVILTCGGTGLWRDVEGTIGKFLMESQSPWQRELSPMVIVDALTGRPDPNGIISSAVKSMGQAGPVALDFLTAYMENCGLIAIKIDTMLTFLLEQLHAIERDFGKFLQRQTSENYNYISNASYLMEGLSRSDVPNHHKDVVETSVLDFNYTTPFAGYTNDYENFHLVNIHGNTSNPIFGIDGRDLMSDPNLVRFTKTYRILALGNREREKIIHTSTGGDRHPTDFIKFYGHSLGDADYSYFQAIFDGVDLYSSDTQLIFYYNLWQQEDGSSCRETVAQQDMFQKVTRLMSEYGKTMSNKDHGKNLMHKLLLEGRLTIKRYR